MRRLPIILLCMPIICLLHIAGDNVTDDLSQSAVIDSSGGRIVLSDERGCTITLSFPKNALLKPTEIALTSLKQKLENPVSQTILTGFRVEPEDLLLREPATLEVRFTEEIPRLSCLFVVLGPDLIVPVAEQEVDSGSRTISGKIYYLKKYAAGVPTEKEIITQIERLKTKARLYSPTVRSQARMMFVFPMIAEAGPSAQTIDERVAYWREDFSEMAGTRASQGRWGSSGACYGWRGTRTNIDGLLIWAQKLMEMGNDAAARDAENAAREVLDQDIESFLEREAPQDPCGNYIMAAMKYAEAAILLGLSTERAEAVQKKIEKLVDRCSIRFSIEIETDIRKDQNEKEQLTSYGVVDAYIPISGELTGDRSLKGEGTLSYKYDYRWKYQEAQNLVHTVNSLGTIKVTIPQGNIYIKQNEAGQPELWLHVSLSYQNNIRGTSCDTANKQNPCVEFVDDHKYGDSLDFPLKSGAVIGFEKSNPEKGTYVKDKKTLYIIHMPTESDRSASECY